MIRMSIFIDVIDPAMCLGKGKGVLLNSPQISDVNHIKGILSEIGIKQVQKWKEMIFE